MTATKLHSQYGWYGIDGNFVAQRVPASEQDEFKRLVGTDQKTVKFLRGEAINGRVPLQEQLEKAQGVFSTTDPQVVFNDGVTPLLQKAPLPFYFYVDWTSLPNPHHLLRNASLRDDTFAYQANLLEKTQLLFEMVDGKRPAIPKGFTDFVCRHHALPNIRWIEWLKEAGHTDLITHLSISWPERASNKVSLADRTIAIVSEQADIPFSPELQGRIQTIFKASEQARLDAMYYTARKELMTASREYWDPTVAPLLSAIHLVQQKSLPESSGKLFDFLVDAEKQELTTDPKTAKHALKTLYLLWDKFNRTIEKEQCISLFHVLKKIADPHAAFTALGTLPEQNSMTPDIAIEFLTFFKDHPDQSLDGFSDYHTWLKSFTYEDRFSLLAALEAFTSCTNAAFRATLSDILPKGISSVTALGHALATYTIAPKHVKDHLKSAARHDEIKKRITPEYITNVGGSIQKNSPIDYSHFNDFLAWASHFNEEPLFNLLVLYRETLDQLEETKKLLTIAFPQKCDLVVCTQLFYPVAALCKKDHPEGFLESLFREMHRNFSPAEIIFILIREDFPKNNQSEKR